MSSLLQFFVGDQHKREIKRLQPLLQRVNDLGPVFERLSDDELKGKTAEFRETFGRRLAAVQADLVSQVASEPDEINQNKIRQRIEQRILDDLLPEAFAAVREAGTRILGMRHFDVQLLGGMILHSGKIGEMRTGEGKTLMATLPAYLNALAGHGVHVVTVNDYLAKRDAQWMGKLYDALGMSVGAIGHEASWIYTQEEVRRQKTEDRSNDGNPNEANKLTANEDWPNLRPVSRKEAYLADIIYGTNNEFGFDYLRDNMAQHSSQLVQRPLWYAIVDEVDSILIDEARTPLIISAPAEESTNLYQTFAQVAKRLTRETDYTVDEKFRSVTITDQGINKVEEWIGVANLYAPDHVPLVHHLEEALKAQGLFSRDKDYVVREGEVVIVDEFTGRMMPGRRYSEGLHQAIEAKEGVEIKRESDTLATISFQNLFRLYAKLSGMTGTASTEAEEFWKIYQIEVIQVPTNRPMVRVDHQDLVYKTEAGKLSAVIAEIKQRSERGQPVLIGTVSVDKNERLSKLLKQAGIKHQLLNAKHHEREAKIITNAGKPGAVTLATNMAGRGVDILLGGEPPKEVNSELKIVNSGDEKENSDSPFTIHHSPVFSKWEEEHQQVLEAGGLYVIATERHEARRIDNQLRGRSGRQGDPGESQFFLSMEDDLMRIFGGERMKALMDRLGVPDDQPIQAKLISGSIESAQRRVEGHNFDIRKHLVEYDDVMNKHREHVYRLRRRILLSSNDKVQMSNDKLNSNDQDSRFQIADPSSWLHQETLAKMDEVQAQAYQQKSEQWGEELAEQVERAIWLRTIDTLWIEHLNAMEALRTGIGLRGYGQHDPLVAYRQEGYQLFERLKRGIEQEVVGLLLNLEVQSQAAQIPTSSSQPPAQRQIRLAGADDSQSAGFGSEVQKSMGQEAERHTATSQAADKVGRNDPCPCGSGKKYKKCHGQ